MGESYRNDMEGKSRGHETVHCESCHRTYRPPEQSMRRGRIHTNTKDSALFDGFPSQYRQIDRGRYDNYNQSDMMKNTELRKETRNVTFDLKSSRSLEQGGSQGEDRRERDQTRRRAKKHEAKVQSSRLLKVKLNMNPLLKSKVHPKRKNDLGHSEESSSKKSKDKRQDGKERREREGKGKSGEKTKGNSEKAKKSTKTKGSTEDREEEKDRREGGQKSKKSSRQKEDKQENTEVIQGENTLLDNTQPGDTTNTADQSASSLAIGQGQDLQGGTIQSQEAGLVLGSAQLSSQHPLSLSATDRNRTTNLSLLGLASSQLTGSSLSLQGGNLLLNTMASGSNALFPSGPAKPVAPSIAISGAPDSFSRTPGVGLVSPASSLLANAVLANPLQASAIHTSAPHFSQPPGLASNLVAKPAPVQSLSQSKLPPDSSPLVVRLMSDPGQEPGLHTGDGVLQRLTLQTQAPLSADVYLG
ncbi:uncharacterized protein lrrc53 isoform X1 [Etheostoma spectabile]|uniref:uncharacterized protein lrrc53 isoform X1 n=1 Tax=Etheostoma spectabile TaxID=54343 RepID=UPI0013AFDB5A|nr:uncharacterized protein LOC116698909 isoform X1 [Etheostoma spectabile]